MGERIEQAAELLLANPVLASLDVLCLQEMDKAGTARLAELLGMNWAYAAAATHYKTGREFGNAVLTPHPIVRQRSVTLPHKAPVRGQARAAVEAVIEVDNGAVSVWSVHAEIPSMPAWLRRRQFSTVASLSADEDRPVIIAADLNTVTARSRRTADALMAKSGFVHASAGSGPTLHRFGRPFTLDHIYVRGFNPDACGVVEPQGTSDHRALWAKVSARSSPIDANSGIG